MYKDKVLAVLSNSFLNKISKHFPEAKNRLRKYVENVAMRKNIANNNIFATKKLLLNIIKNHMHMIDAVTIIGVIY